VFYSYILSETNRASSVF